jgi:acyl-coenzyme A thioesterase PaaI-like protein
MSVYKKAYEMLEKYIPANRLLKWGLNWSPMFRRTTGKIIYVSEDLHKAVVKIPISWRNRNYVGSIFGGSLFSATDPIGMMQVLQILGKDYVVWDKSSEIRFRKPAYQDVYAHFEISQQDIDTIKLKVKEEGQTDFDLVVPITNQEKEVLYTEIKKTIYIADKAYYKAKRKAKRESQRD